MTTKAASSVAPALEKSIEKIAYASVAGIPTVEPHDRDRLGYNIWRWLTYRKDPLEFAVKTSGSRLLITEEEAVQKIRESLQQQGVAL
jgi:hypothetical protein